MPDPTPSLLDAARAAYLELEHQEAILSSSSDGYPPQLRALGALVNGLRAAIDAADCARISGPAEARWLEAENARLRAGLEVLRQQAQWAKNRSAAVDPAGPWAREFGEIEGGCAVLLGGGPK